MLLRLHRLPRVASSFWIDCSRLEGFSLITGKIKCWIMKAGFKLALKLRGVRDRMPLDHTCEAIYFILDRKKRQWWKCCRQVIPPLIFACQEVEPTGWYAQRNEHGVTMPFSHEDAQMCFREKSSPDQNCPMLFCDNIRDCFYTAVGRASENANMVNHCCDCGPGICITTSRIFWNLCTACPHPSQLEAQAVDLGSQRIPVLTDILSDK